MNSHTHSSQAISSSHTHLEQKPDGTLVIEYATRDMTDIFTCTAANDYDKISTNAFLEIRGTVYLDHTRQILLIKLNLDLFLNFFLLDLFLDCSCKYRTSCKKILF